jgi:membrane associated rhomboid family serine protease
MNARGDPPGPVTDPEAPEREPLFRAPLVVLAVCAALVGSHLWVVYGPAPLQQTLSAYALTSDSIAAGRWVTLITYNFLHAGWMHLILNTAFCLAFGTGPARLFGRGGRGAAVFVVFFLFCGAVTGLVFAAIQTASPWAIIGASGAVAGLMGATARMLEPGQILSAPWSRSFLGMAIGWVLINVILGFTPAGPALAGGADIAWQAHLIGFAIGAGMIDLFWGLAGRRLPTGV